MIPIRKENRDNNLSCFIITLRIINNIQNNTNEEREKDENIKIIVVKINNSITGDELITLLFITMII